MALIYLTCKSIDTALSRIADDIDALLFVLCSKFVKSPREAAFLLPGLEFWSTLSIFDIELSPLANDDVSDDPIPGSVIFSADENTGISLESTCKSKAAAAVPLHSGRSSLAINGKSAGAGGGISDSP